MSISNIIRDFGVRVSMIFDKKTADDANARIGVIEKNLKFLSIAAVGSAAGILEIANIASTQSRALQTNSQQLGINVERLQELEYAAKVTANVGVDELTDTLQGLAKTLFEARNNNVEAAQTLIRMGVPLKMITDRSIQADQVLLNLSERFKQMPDGMNKTALANEVFGASGSKLIPLLNKGAEGIARMGKEARAYGLVMSTKAVNTGADFDRQLTKIWLIMKNLTYVMGTEFLKAIAPMLTEFLKFISANRKFITSGIIAFVKDYALIFKGIIGVMREVNQNFLLWVKNLGGQEKIFKTLIGIMDFLIAIPIVKALAAIGFSLLGLGVAVIVLLAPFAVFGLLLTSLYFIIRGGINIVSDFVRSVKELFITLGEVGGPAKVLNSVFDSLQAKLGQVSNKFATVHGWIQKGTGAMEELGDTIANSTFGKTLSSIGDALWTPIASPKKVAKPASAASTKKDESFTSSISERFSEMIDFITKPKYPTHLSTPLAGGGGTGGTTTNNLSATVNVSVPRGTEPATAEKMVSGGVQKGFQAILRQTRDQFLGGVQ